MAQSAADTGQGPAAIVAIEQYLPKEERVLNDDLAGKILPMMIQAYLGLMRFKTLRNWTIGFTEKKVPGTWAMVLCRKRYIEEKATEAVKNQVYAVVNLGAGFDTLVYRLPAGDDFKIYEIDQPMNIETKRKKLRRVLGEIPSHINLVPIDFDQQELLSVLKSHSYRTDEKAFMILEGVTQYLSETGVRSTFNFFSEAPAGSRLVFTYVLRDFLEGNNLYNCTELYQRFVQKSRIWKFGIDPDNVADFVEEFGWRVLEHVGYHELIDRFVKPTGRQLASLPIERLVYAEKL